MLSKYILPVSACLLSHAVFSQPVITDIIPNIGDQFIYVQYEQVPDPGPAGSNLTWEFTDVGTPLFQMDTEVSLPEDVPGAALFPESTMAWQMDIGFGVLNTFFDFENGVWTEHGIFSDAFGSAETVYTDPYERIAFPFTYLDTGTDSFEKSITAGGITTDYTGATSYEVDAYGSLTLNSGTFNDVVRVSVEITEEFDAGGQTNFTNTTEHYWYSSEYPVALCITSIITSEFGGAPAEPDSSFIQLMVYNMGLLNTGENEARLDFELYPNPAAEFIQIRYEHPENGELRIYDASGKLIRSEPIRSESKIDIRDLSPGVYVASVSVKGSAYSNVPFVVSK